MERHLSKGTETGATQPAAGSTSPQSRQVLGGSDERAPQDGTMTIVHVLACHFQDVDHKSYWLESPSQVLPRSLVLAIPMHASR